MCNESDSWYEKARCSVEGLFKTMMTAAGLMLTLLWGLTQGSNGLQVVYFIRVASILLVLAIIFSFLGLQFIVSFLEKEEKKITKQRSVAFSFFGAWISFIAGCVVVILAIFQYHP